MLYNSNPSRQWASIYAHRSYKITKALFGCCRIHLNPHALEWIGVEFSSSSTPIHPNTCGLMRIRLHPNNAQKNSPQPMLHTISGPLATRSQSLLVGESRSSVALWYLGEGDGGARRLLRRQRGRPRHDGGQQRRRRGPAPLLEVSKVPDHVGLADHLRVHVCLAFQHGDHRRHPWPAFRDVLGAEEPNLQKPAGFIDVQVIAQGTVYDLLQIPPVVISPCLQKYRSVLLKNEPLPWQVFCDLSVLVESCIYLLKENLVIVGQFRISVASSTHNFDKQNAIAVDVCLPCNLSSNRIFRSQVTSASKITVRYHTNHFWAIKY